MRSRELCKIQRFIRLRCRFLSTATPSDAGNQKFEGKVIETVPARVHSYLFPRIPVPSTSSAKEYVGELPELTENDVVEHFRIIAENQTNGYKNLLEEASQFDLRRAFEVLQKIDTNEMWRLRAGWTRYPFDLVNIEKVDYPPDGALFFDVETCMTDGNLPTLAIAMGKDAWYGWCSERLVSGSAVPEKPRRSDLIGLGDTGLERVVIGHNIGYDRARCGESYGDATKMRFMCTMSMSIPMFGMADHQQALYEKNDLEADQNSEWLDTWKGRVSKNSLAAVHDHFYFGSKSKESVLSSYWDTSDGLSKKTLRTSFVKDPIEKIREDFQILMSYCARDNIMCAEIYVKLWAEFKSRFPHAATLAGMLNMGNAYLPINSYWAMFYDENVRICAEKKTSSAREIVKVARMLLEHGEEYTGSNDVWMSAHEWTTKKKAAYPEWYFKLFKSRSAALMDVEELESEHLVLKSSLVPSIFGFIYGPYPLFKTKTKGWGYLVPNVQKIKNVLAKGGADTMQILRDGSDDDVDVKKFEFPLRKFLETVEKNRSEYGNLPISPDRLGFDMGGDLVRFYQLDHPTGDGNVGDPLTKHFAKDVDSGLLRPTRFVDHFKVVLDSIQTTQFWTSYSERYNDEVAVWFDDKKWLNAKGEEMCQGAIAPAVVPAGTVSRRSVHKLWVTLTNQSAGSSVIGTGIKAMVQAPEGYRLVGADVDSQEQWLAALFGDASAEKKLSAEQRMAGRTAFSNMMLAGSKSDNTDLHSVVANQLKISRNHAKTLNYARLYGSGETHATKHLVRMGGMREAEAATTARELFRLTKGEEARFRKVHTNAIPLVDMYLSSLSEKQTKEDVGSEILSVEGDYYIPTYTSQFARTTVDFEKWVMDKFGHQFSSLRDENSDVSPEELILPHLYEDFGDSRRFYYGGYESSTFNYLELAASAHLLRTPVLGCQLADSLAKLPEDTPQASHYDRKYKRSVMNWIVQSSAVDFLHLLLVSMTWICEKYSIDARFVISIHDEVRYLCREEDSPRVGLALQLSNLLVRAFISQTVGIQQLPATISFFSQVDCDTVLRKEVDSPCVNPDGTEVPQGVAWNIDDLLRLTEGKLSRRRPQ